eukprot:m.124055 g.124055  ORF g.124055 m.124055 type:complete len:57 (+) comp14464_c0_seq3:1727-1897(+)
MALHSNRVFWNVVHHGKIGPSVSFEQALRSFLPDEDWKKHLERHRKLKYSSLEWAS